VVPADIGGMGHHLGDPGLLPERDLAPPIFWCAPPLTGLAWRRASVPAVWRMRRVRPPPRDKRAACSRRRILHSAGKSLRRARHTDRHAPRYRARVDTGVVDPAVLRDYAQAAERLGYRPPVTSIRPKLCRLANVTNTEVPGTKAWPREDQALLSRAADRLAFVRHRQADFPKRTITSGKLCAPNSVALNRVFFQCSPVGRGDQALCRQNTGGRAACNTFRSDEFGNRRCLIFFGSVSSCSDLNVEGPM
jgi:hypothetical protein